MENKKVRVIKKKVNESGWKKQLLNFKLSFPFSTLSLRWSNNNCHHQLINFVFSSFLSHYSWLLCCNFSGCSGVKRVDGFIKLQSPASAKFYKSFTRIYFHEHSWLNKDRRMLITTNFPLLTLLEEVIEKFVNFSLKYITSSAQWHLIISLNLFLRYINEKTRTVGLRWWTDTMCETTMMIRLFRRI